MRALSFIFPLLVLRRGVVLRGRLIDERGAPVPDTLLNDFELVPRSLDEWHPEQRGRPGAHQRIVADRATWLARASAGQQIELRLQTYSLVPLTVQVTDSSGAALTGRSVQVWTRTAPDQYMGQAPSTDARGRVRVLVESGVTTELWVTTLGTDQHLEAPWTRGVNARWTGAPTSATQITVAVTDD